MGSFDRFLDFRRMDRMPGHMAGVVGIPIEALEAIEHSISIYNSCIYGNVMRLASPKSPELPGG